MIKIKGRFKNACEVTGTLELKDLRDIYTWLYYDHVSQPFLIFNNCEGGAFSTELLNTIITHPTLSTIAIGTNCSAAAVFIVLSPYSEMGIGSRLMFHGASDSENVDEINNFVMEEISAMSGLTKREVFEKVFGNLERDVYLTADQCFDLQLTDKVGVDMEHIRRMI